MDELKNYIDKLFENQTFITIFIITVSVFAAHIAPKLPKSILKMFNSNIVKIIFMAFIAYSATKNIGISLVTSIALLVIIQSLRSLENQEKFINKITETTQITSNSRVKLIGQMIENPNIDIEQKVTLVNNVMDSIASNKHKFDTGLLLINSNPETQTQVIDKLYDRKTNIKPNNVVNMSYRLIFGNYVSDKHIPKIIIHILKLPINDNEKKNIIITVLKSDINKKTKLRIIDKINKSDVVSMELKNEIIN
jgi:hypothetical protein